MLEYRVKTYRQLRYNSSSFDIYCLSIHLGNYSPYLKRSQMIGLSDTFALYNSHYIFLWKGYSDLQYWDENLL